MDLKCIRVLKPYDSSEDDKMNIYIDDATRESLFANWGDEIVVEGKRDVKATIRQLKSMDEDVLIGRAGQKLIDALYIEYGEEVILKD